MDKNLFELFGKYIQKYQRLNFIVKEKDNGDVEFTYHHKLGLPDEFVCGGVFTKDRLDKDLVNLALDDASSKIEAYEAGNLKVYG